MFCNNINNNIYYTIPTLCYFQCVQAMKSFVNVSLLLNTDDYPSKNCGLSIEGNL